MSMGIQKGKQDAKYWLLMLWVVGCTLGALALGGSRLLSRLSGPLPETHEPAALQAMLDIGHSLAADVERVTQPAIQRGRLLAASTEVIDSIARSNSQSLTELCNRSIMNATEIDAIAIFDEKGKILAINSVYADGRPISHERINKILQSDFSGRKIIHSCLNNDLNHESLEFQTNCDITPAYFDSSGLSIAYSVPVFDNLGKKAGVVSVRLRFERVSSLISNRRIANGLGSIHFVSDVGGFFDETINRGGTPPLPPNVLASITSPLASGNAIQLTVAREDKLHLLFRVQNLKTLEGGGIQALITVPTAWLNSETNLANLLVIGERFSLGVLLLALVGGISLLQKARLDIAKQTNEKRRLRSVFSAVTDGIVLQNASGEIVECNAAAERILGLSLDQMRGRTSMDPRWKAINEDGSLLQGDQHPAIITLRTGQPIRSFVFGIHTPQGAKRWISVSSEPIFDSVGKVSSVVTSFADITLLREQSRRLQVIVDASRIGTWDWEIPSGDVVFNDHWARMLGYELSELEPHVSTWERILDPEGFAQAWTIVQKHIAGDTHEYRNEMRLRRKDGSYAWILAAGRIISRFSDGTPNRMVGIHIDITESKTYETKLKELAERYAAVTTGTSDGLWDWECQTENCWYSERFWILLGFPADGPLPSPTLKSLIDRLHPDDVAQEWEFIRRHREEGIEYDHEIRLRHENGEYRWFRTRGATQYGADGRPIRMAGSIQDIHDLKSTQNSLIEANKRAESANAAKSEFLANMSHEIRTPMTAILGFADLLMNEIDSEIGHPSSAQYVDTIRRNGEHLLEIINDVLDISKIEAGKMSVEIVPVNPERMIQDVLSLMSVKAQAKGVQLSSHFEENIPTTIHTDPVRLRQILVNLIGNAIKFTELGSVSLRVRSNAVEQRLHIAIEDTGIGLSELQISRLFGAFEQADTTTTRKYGGTGLGLFISNRLAEMLGGKISVESRLGKGSTFTLSIATGPVSSEVSSIHDQTRKNSPVRDLIKDRVLKGERPLAGMRILFAEDGPDNQRLIAHVLRKAGAEVQIAENGKLALEMLTIDGSLESPLKDPCPFHLLLCDMQMPEMDGYTAVRWLREKRSVLPIVALTAHAMSDDLKLCMAAGCNAYASKPINKATLVALCLEWAGDFVEPSESTILSAG